VRVRVHERLLRIPFSSIPNYLISESFL